MFPIHAITVLYLEEFWCSLIWGGNRLSGIITKPGYGYLLRDVAPMLNASEAISLFGSTYFDG